MPKAPRAKSLIELMEWLKLGKKYHIHKDFLKYFEMTDIIRFCLISPYYYKKYLSYCYNYFIVKCSPFLSIMKNHQRYHFYYLQNKYHFVNPLKIKTNKYDFLIINSNVEFLNSSISYEEFLSLKKLYGTNKKLTKIINKYFDY